MGSRIGLPGGLPRTIVLWWRAWRKQVPDDRPPERPVDPALANAALARADPALAKAEVRSSMRRMMRHFRIDPAQVLPRFWGELHTAEKLCARCAAVGRCQRWSHGLASDDDPRRFCPNAKLYDEIARSQGRAHDPCNPPTT